MGSTCELTSALGPTDVQEWKGEWTFEGRLKVDLKAGPDRPCCVPAAVEENCSVRSLVLNQRLGRLVLSR